MNGRSTRGVAPIRGLLTRPREQVRIVSPTRLRIDHVKRSVSLFEPSTMKGNRRSYAFRRLPDVVICVYDLKRHSALVIARVLASHPAALVGGVLRASQTHARASARDRILAAASQLFNERGIQATGSDSLVGAAGVAKATFYRHFPAKNDLVVAWLRDPQTRWLDHIRAEIEANGTDAGERIPLFFDAVADWLAGSITLAVARRDRAPVETARDAALTLLAEAERD